MHRLIGVGALVLLGGCEWLGLSSSAPANTEKARPGAERQANVTNSLPAARGAGYDAAVAPVDETRTGGRIGSMVQGKGGQKAQKEAADKEAAERDAKAREERARAEREAALRKAQEGEKAGEKAGEKKAASTEAAPAPATPPAVPSDTKQ